LPPFEPNDWFRQHVQPHEAMLRAWLRARYDVRADLDDVVQEALLRVLRAKRDGTLRAVKPFLFAAARNLALDRLRRHGVARTDSLGEIEALHVLDEGVDIPEAAAPMPGWRTR
jgi:RNA polymerase sigma-70 factor (ECF subfamily)